MRSQKLFQEYYEPKLIEHGIDNIVLRTYTHIKGLSTDDPDNSTELIFTPRKEVDSRLDSIYKEFGEGKGMAVTSIVSAHNEQKLLFLLDCSVPVSPTSEAELVNIVRKSKGILPAFSDTMLLRTQNSYHLACFTPLSKDEWYKHMAQAILLKGSTGECVVDVRYIGHSLERGYGSLRISDYQGKPTPDFISYL